MAWSYKREENSFAPLPEGKYRIRIKSAEKTTSKNGNDMLALQFDVSGTSKILYHYIVFMADKPEITNRMLTQFFDSFAKIEEGDLNTQNWIGKVGACKIKHDTYNDSIREKISYFISADKQGDLPPWKEPAGIEAKNLSGIATDENGFMNVTDLETDENMPFF